MKKKSSTIGPVIDLVRQTRIRPLTFGVFCSVLFFLAFQSIYPAVAAGPEREGPLVWLVGTIMIGILMWILTAAIFRCLQATFSTYYIRGGEKGLSVSLPTGHWLSLFAPFYMRLKKDFLWEDLGSIKVEVDEEDHVFSEISLIVEIQQQSYRVKNLPFVEGVDIIEDILEKAKSFSKENFSLLNFHQEVGVEFTTAVATNSFSTVWYRVIGLSLVGILIYGVIHYPNSPYLLILLIPTLLITFLPIILGALLEVNWNQAKSLMAARVLTFSSGCAFPLIVVFGGSMKMLPQEWMMMLIPCALGMNCIMPVILASKLNRSSPIWMLLAIVTSGISNLILSVQEKD